MIPKRLFIKFTKAALIISLTLGCHASYAKHLLVYGDSLSAGYGMDLDKGWVYLLGESLGADYTVSNASVSGETTKGGLARLAVTLDELKPDAVLLQLGANDGLQGQPVNRIKQNLSKMIEKVKATDAEVVIAGISIPPSYGPRYIDEFRQIFPDLAKQHQVDYIDLYREEFFSSQDYIQADGLHPTEVTQPAIRDAVLAFITEKGILNRQ